MMLFNRSVESQEYMYQFLRNLRTFVSKTVNFKIILNVSIWFSLVFQLYMKSDFYFYCQKYTIN